jgi:hypothetical protein
MSLSSIVQDFRATATYAVRKATAVVLATLMAIGVGFAQKLAPTVPQGDGLSVAAGMTKDFRSLLYELTTTDGQAPVATVTKPAATAGPINVKYHTDDPALQKEVIALIGRLAPGITPTIDPVVDAQSKASTTAVAGPTTNPAQSATGGSGQATFDADGSGHVVFADGTKVDFEAKNAQLKAAAIEVTQETAITHEKEVIGFRMGVSGGIVNEAFGGTDVYVNGKKFNFNEAGGGNFMRPGNGRAAARKENGHFRPALDLAQKAANILTAALKDEKRTDRPSQPLDYLKMIQRALNDSNLKDLKP